MTTIATPSQIDAAAALPSNLSTLHDKSYPTVRWGWVGCWGGYALLEDESGGGALLLGHPPEGSAEWVSRSGYVASVELDAAAVSAVRQGIATIAAAHAPYADAFCGRYAASPRPCAATAVERILRSLAATTLTAEAATTAFAAEAERLRSDTQYLLAPTSPGRSVAVAVGETVDAEARRLHVSVREAARRRAQRAERRTIRI